MQPNTDKKPSIRNFTALRPYLSLLHGQARDLSLTIVLMLASTAVTLAIPVFAGRFVDVLSNSDGIAGLGRTHLLIMALLLVFQLLGTFFSTVISARLGYRTVTRLRQRIYAHLLELPALFFSGQKAGDISSRVTSDVGGIQYMLTSGIIGLVRAVLTLVGSIILMLNLNARLTLAVLLLIPATIGLARDASIITSINASLITLHCHEAASHWPVLRSSNSWSAHHPG